MADSNSNINEAMKRLKDAETALADAETALATMIINDAGSQDHRDKAAAAVAAASNAVVAARSQVEDVKGFKGGRRKHKARGTKRRRHSGGFPDFRNILPPSLANLFGLSPPPPPPPSSAQTLTPQQPGIQGGKSGKKRKHSRRKY